MFQNFQETFIMPINGIIMKPFRIYWNNKKIYFTKYFTIFKILISTNNLWFKTVSPLFFIMAIYYFYKRLKNCTLHIIKMLFNQFHRVISSPPQKNTKNYHGTYNLYYIFHLCPGLILLANSFRNFIKKK